MPLLVHDLLEGGYNVLSSVPGLESLKETVFRDPEVLATLSEIEAET
jgi:hypothetical protein